MKINLFMNVYRDNDPRRQEELDYCLQKNIDNKHVQRIVCIVSREDERYFLDFEKRPGNGKMLVMVLSTRPTYNNFFSLMVIFPDDVNIIMNTDIYIDERALELILDFYSRTAKTCMALTRWDEDPQTKRLKFFERPDSQDIWIFKGSPVFIRDADFTLGRAGCDNKIAYLLEQAGYQVINPSKSIQTVHVHSSNVRNYNASEDRQLIKPPFKTIQPTIL